MSDWGSLIALWYVKLLTSEAIQMPSKRHGACVFWCSIDSVDMTLMDCVLSHAMFRLFKTI